MKPWKLLLAVPVVAALAMVPQGQGPGNPAAVDSAHIVSMSELQYITRSGKEVQVSARNVVEIRLLEDINESIRLELYYENGDYSLIDAQAFHILRTGQSTREVKLVRGTQSRMRFPKGIG